MAVCGAIKAKLIPRPGEPDDMVVDMKLFMNCRKENITRQHMQASRDETQPLLFPSYKGFHESRPLYASELWEGSLCLSLQHPVWPTQMQQYRAY